MSNAARHSCRHFNGIHRPCSAGLEYPATVIGTCIRSAPKPGALPPRICPQIAPFTAEELAAEERDRECDRGHEQHVKKLNVACAAITKDAKGRRGISGKLPCPVCTTGTLHYSIAGCNGHVHAKCTTPDCIAFMQ